MTRMDSFSIRVEAQCNSSAQRTDIGRRFVTTAWKEVLSLSSPSAVVWVPLCFIHGPTARGGRQRRKMSHAWSGPSSQSLTYAEGRLSIHWRMWKPGARIDNAERTAVDETHNIAERLEDESSAVWILERSRLGIALLLGLVLVAAVDFSSTIVRSYD